MPQVPRYDGQRQSLSSAPTPLQRSSATPEAFGAGIARGVGRIGNELEKAGNVAVQNALKIQNEDNQAEADDLITKYLLAEKDLLYVGDNAYYTKQGKDSYEGYKPAQEGVVTLRDTVSGEASNPVVRRLVDSATRRQMTFSLGNMASRAASERKKWLINSADSAMAVAIDKAALYYNNDEAFNEAMQDVIDQNFVKARHLGWGPAEFDRSVALGQSKAWDARIRRTMQEDPFVARDLFEANEDKLTAEDNIALGNALKTLVTPQEVKRAASEIPAMLREGRPIVSPSGLGAIIRDYGERSPSRGGRGQVSPKSAMGPMQVLPATAAGVARSLGIAFNPKDPKDIARLRDDEEFNTMIGDAYLDQQLKRFGGDPLKAAAAYNAGPGWVDAAVKRADEAAAAGTIGPQADWRWQLKNDRRMAKYNKETDDYISRVESGLAEQGETRSVEVAETLESRLAAAKVLAERDKPGNAVYADMLERQVKSDWNEEKTIQRTEELGAQDRLYTVVSGGVNADGQKPKSVAQLLRDPQNQKDWLSLPQTTRNAIINQIEANAKPEKEAKKAADPKVNRAFKAFLAEAQLSPDTFLSRDFPSMTFMSEGMQRTLIQKQMTVSAGQPQIGDKNLDRGMRLAPIQNALAEARIEKDSDEYREFTGAFLDNIETLSAIAGGRPLKDDELQDMAFKALAYEKNKFVPKSGGIISAEVPNEAARDIVAAYRIMYPGRIPSTTDIARIHAASEARKASKANGRK